MAYKRQLNIRIAQDTKDKLQAIADKEKRKLNDLARVIIEEYLENKEV
jgi:predicted DNA-binding protein